MLVHGADTSSSSSGFALVDGYDLRHKARWAPPPRASRPVALLDYYRSLHGLLDDLESHDLMPEVAIVEELSVTRGHKTVRALSHFEGVTYLVYEERGVIVKTIKPGEVRAAVLDLPITASKLQVLAEVRRRWPDIRWSPSNQGGEDEAEAFVTALSWEKVLRR